MNAHSVMFRGLPSVSFYEANLLKSSGTGASRPTEVGFFCYLVSATLFLDPYTVASLYGLLSRNTLHIRILSLRATATIAFCLLLDRRYNDSKNRLNPTSFCIAIHADSTNNVLKRRLPVCVISPRLICSPEDLSHGTKPQKLPISRTPRNPFGSPIEDRIVTAVIKPIPGIDSI